MASRLPGPPAAAGPAGAGVAERGAHREHRQPGEHHRTTGGAQPAEVASYAVVVAVSAHGLADLPDHEGGEAGGGEPERDRAERLLGDLGEGALAGGRTLGVAEREPARPATR
ncbi:hypothetical protein [Nocardioides convexus]|uniref:hypothetical protein n=1 Tax=Nocardioides convexus TaxID=2712224 RepID=UPI002418B4EB|nr:hypothetical protein [Nocardioides convexus]